MSYLSIVKSVSEELNIPSEVVDKTYKAYWFYIKSYIESLPLKEDINELDFLNIKININIPSLGKLNCTYDRLKGIKTKYKEKVK